MEISIKNYLGGLLFKHKEINNTLKITIECAVKSKANLSRADLSRANLSGADLSRANLSRANLSWADLSGANLSRADLSGADLSGANLSGADLSRANLSGADLSGANLSGADLSGANLSRANLSWADLSGADLSWADLSGANLIRTTYGFGVDIGSAPIFIYGLIWPVYIFKTHIKIGCQLHSKEKWMLMDDEKISNMEERALDFWKKYKKHILWLASTNN